MISPPDEVIDELPLPPELKARRDDPRLLELVSRCTQEAREEYRDLFSAHGRLGTKLALELAKNSGGFAGDHDAPPPSGRHTFSEVNGQRFYLTEDRHPELFVIRDSLAMIPDRLADRIEEEAVLAGLMKHPVTGEEDR